MLPAREALRAAGAEETVPAMKLLVEAARAAGIVHVASADDHELTDGRDLGPARLRHDVSAALSARHARRAQDPGDRAGGPVPLALEPAAGALLRGRREFLLLKKSFDVFTNPNTDRVARPPAAAEEIVRLRRRHGRLRRRRDPRFPLPRPLGALRGGRRRRASTTSAWPPARPSGATIGSRSPLLRRPPTVSG